MKAHCLVLALGLASPALWSHELVELTGMVRTAHTVLRGYVTSTQEVKGGVLHRLAVVDLLWGELPGRETWLFTLAPEVPDAPHAPLQDQFVLGVCWIDGSDPAWQERLAGANLKPGAQRIGVLCADGQLLVPGNESLLAELAEWIRSVREATDTDQFEAVALRLLRHESPHLRKSVLDELATRQLVNSPEIDLAMHHALSHENSPAGNASCLASVRNFLHLSSPAKIENPPAPALALTVLNNLKSAAKAPATKAQGDTTAR